MWSIPLCCYNNDNINKSLSNTTSVLYSMGVATLNPVVTKNTIMFLFVLLVNVTLYTLNTYSGHGSMYEGSAV
jgi:hypothetical protein